MTQSVDPASKQEQSTVSGFHSYDAISYENFNSRNMSDIERIIATFRDTPKTQSILKFYDQIRDHLNDRTDHNLNISRMSEELIHQLFYTYRSLGFPGSKADMITAMVKTITIGSIRDTLAGVSTTKAVNVPGWVALFDEHSTDPQAHAIFFNSLTPNDACNYDPDFYLSYFIGTQDFLLTSEGYVTKDWNPIKSTLYLYLSYDFRGIDEVKEVDILKFKFDDRTMRLYASYEPSIKNVNIFLEETNKITTKILGAVALSFNEEGYDKLLMLLDRSDMILRSMTAKSPKLDNPFKVAPHYLEVLAPIQARSNAEHPVTIKEISHYPVTASISEQLFFLN